MATKQNVNPEKEEETVEAVQAVENAPVTEGTAVSIEQEQTEQEKPRPVPKGSRRGSKALQLELEKTKELAQANEEKYKRLQADYENMTQRNEKEAGKMYDFGAKDVLEKLLPVVDNFERALSSIPEEDMERGFEQGVDKIYRQLIDCLDNMGVTPMDAEGKEFDPEYHHAVSHVEDENYGENIVVEEMQKGYMYKDQVLRFSMVKVAN